MIQMETKLNITDNTGAKIGKVIQIWKSNKGLAPLASSIVRLSIQELKSKLGAKKAGVNKGSAGQEGAISSKSGQVTKSISKGALALGVVVRTNRNVFRKNHIKTRFFDNAVVLLDPPAKGTKVTVAAAEAALKGTRIFGPVSSKLRKPNAGSSSVKILSLAGSVH